jgi:membrane fusion protein (multidrug efflux system)
MKKSYFIAVLGLLGIVGILGGIKALQINALIESGASMLPPPSAVSSSVVESQAWEVTLSAVGSLEAVQGVMVSAEVPGRVSSLHFTPGSDVKRGDLLVQQDISAELAQLRAAEANVALAKSDLKRMSELVAKKVIPISQFDSAEARFKEAFAQQDIVKSTIDKKTIRAPFDGRLGLRLINLGQDLGSGEHIVSLQANDPVFVNFNLPQRQLPNLKVDMAVRVASDAVPGHIFTGKITAISPEVNASTRNVLVQATLENKELNLLPGMFVSVAVVSPDIDQVLAIPNTAVAYATFGDSVFVVTEQQDPKTGEKTLVASQQFVQLGRAKGDFVEVKAGVKVGETVVSAGVFKLQNGAPILINNDTRPEFKLNPTPDNT